jgi:tripartite ATP-independent transporter DctM subunit
MIAAAFLAFLVVVILVAGVASGTTTGVVELLAGSVVFAIFFVSGVYVAAALAVMGLLTGILFSNRPLVDFTGQIAWNASANFILVAVPLFILMGELLLGSGASNKLYGALNVWTRRIPGGLVHTNIVASAMFAAVSGSSVATSATIGKVALPYFERTNYDQKMVLGSLAAGGTLGILIPPSINLIIYGLLTDTSVGRLYAAGFIPGFMLAGLFMAYIWFASRRQLASEPPGPAASFSELRQSAIDLVPTASLIVLVLGSIYLGFATPTEAAAVGVIGAAILALLAKGLTFRLVADAARSTARTTSMIGLIIIGAFILNFAITQIGLPRALAELVTGLQVPGWLVMLIIIAFYIGLGTFMESLSMMITTIPITFPIVLSLGYDPVWFGVVLMILMEMALISPPDGMNIYVIQAMRLRPGPITDVFVGLMPFLALMGVAVGLLLVFPQLALWLPDQLIR